MINLPKQPCRGKRAPKGKQRANREAWEKARTVREQMTRFAKQADVAKVLNVTRSRLEQLEIEVIAKLVVAMAREDSPEGVDVTGLRKQISAAVPGVREFLPLMSAASLALVAEIVAELNQDHGSVFPEF